MGGVEHLLGKGSEAVGEVAEDWSLSIDETAGTVEHGLKSAQSVFVARVQTINILVLLPAMGIIAIASLVDAWCKRRISALTFCTSVSSANFWLVQASGVLAAGALRIAAMPFE